ncbi:Uncharacterised protein [Klebsiella pneumoniae]|uniref:Uncharacterized protein n=1 Tax=Klebsiella pneumoniae TaxID=573 RepID=A0A378AHE3_KLEPN|nr:Uncharacterised protein [Klebsiella pneumoniae]STV09249.1 Uncharacterised protein [Klebsiella pneumoniae]
MTGSCSACAQSAKVRESESGVNQPPAPSTNTQSARPSSSRSPLESLAAAIGRPSSALMMCGEVGSAKV